MSSGGDPKALDSLLDQIERREHQTRRRVLMYTVVPIVVAVTFLGYSLYRIQDATIRAGELERAVREGEKKLSEVQHATLASQAELQDVREKLRKSRESVNYVTEGINAYHARRYDIAVERYDQALALDPLNPYVQNLKGYSLFKAGKPNEAIDALHRSVEIDSTYAWGWFDLARVLCASGQLDHAKTAAQRALDLRRDLRDVMMSDGEFRRLCQKQIP